MYAGIGNDNPAAIMASATDAHSDSDIVGVG
jgi:hypothetical protein